MKSFPFRYYLIFLSISFALDCFAGAANLSDEMSRKAEVFGLVAKAIIDRECVILIAETRYDSAFMPNPRPLRQYIAVTGILELRTLFPIRKIRGLDIENRIWIQIDPTDILERNKRFHHIPALASEGVWMCFLRPVRNLPRTFGSQGGELSDQIALFSKDHSPTEVAERFSFSSWLNRKTWFVPAFDFSIFQIDRKIRDLSLPINFQQHDADQLNGRISRTRATSSEFEKNQFKFSDLEVEEVVRLVMLFDKRDQIPSIDEITENDSEIGDEIIRQLASTSSDQLDAELRKIKESMSQSILEKVFPAK